MMSITKKVNFSDLLSEDVRIELQHQLDSLLLSERQNINTDPSIQNSYQSIAHVLQSNEELATTSLIELFNTLFIDDHVQLIRGEGEPEYHPATHLRPARIEFAYGFFASALHELSHWCIAGPARRKLADFGYWYAADGRTLNQQRAFEQVEIRPQAIECLFTLACKRNFQVSTDNIFATYDTSWSHFSMDVYKQAKSYLNRPESLPLDAQRLLQALLKLEAIS